MRYDEDPMDQGFEYMDWSTDGALPLWNEECPTGFRPAGKKRIQEICRPRTQVVEAKLPPLVNDPEEARVPVGADAWPTYDEEKARIMQKRIWASLQDDRELLQQQRESPQQKRRRTDREEFETGKAK